MSQKTLKLMEALGRRYVHPDRAIIFEFRGGTGWSRESRADAIAMDLWPSRGLELVGFEIKTSRADWLREVKNPTKCDAIKQFCDKWYLVVDDQAIVRRWPEKDELPEDWGLIVPNYQYHITGALDIKKEAPKLNPKPIDRAFLASLMRIAADPIDEINIQGKTYVIKTA